MHRKQTDVPVAVVSIPVCGHDPCTGKVIFPQPPHTEHRTRRWTDDPSPRGCSALEGFEDGVWLLMILGLRVGARQLSVRSTGFPAAHRDAIFRSSALRPVLDLSPVVGVMRSHRDFRSCPVVEVPKGLAEVAVFVGGADDVVGVDHLERVTDV